ncbi:MAG: N-formylglutamate amidohydrolase [Rhodospirillaceae bacterium]|nr:N-formylglutamate amidohydrolase [Rhodospirillaceae bacterium]
MKIVDAMVKHKFPHIGTFSLDRPDLQRFPIVVSSPHSGRLYPSDFRKIARISVDSLRRSEDRFVDLLVEDIPVLGVPVLAANFPRSFLDLNRSPMDLDPELISGLSTTLTRGLMSPRVRQGLGVIPRVAANGAEIYNQSLSIGDARRRLLSYYFPYHKMLRALISSTCAKFGLAVLFDVHSMPSRAVNISGNAPRTVVLGNAFGSSAPAYLTDMALKIFSRLGYQVFRNEPYSGGFITQHYGQLERGVFVLQVEICRAAYMDEETLRPREGFSGVKKDLAQFVMEFAESLSLLQAAE